ncbi:unnamed protein product, partial [Rotaria socialis]
NWTKADKDRNWYNGGYECFTKRNDGATCLDLDLYLYLLDFGDLYRPDLRLHVCLCDRH